MRTTTRLRAVVFDFDGTLARPALDFALMQRRIGQLAAAYPRGAARPGPLPALEWIESLAASMDGRSGERFRQEAHALIERMEHEAAARTSLFPFVRPMLDGLRGMGVHAAVITRNCRAAVASVFPDAGKYFGAFLTREDVDAVKPDPAHLFAALHAVGAKPEEALMVGDHPLDVLTARRAGTLAGAVASGETTEGVLAEAGPDFMARDAGELLARLRAERWFGA